MEYVAYDELAGRPSIIVDGFGAKGTVLVLSHWKGSGTPDELKDDLSTQIAFRYLDRPDLKVAAGAVSNNHFDEDGLCGIYAVLNPGDAMQRRERLIDVASAGDFETWRDRDSARISLAVRTLWDEERSPLSPETWNLPYPRQAAALHEHALAMFPELLDDPTTFKSLWEDEDAKVQSTLDALAAGSIAIDERPEIDLAIVRVNDGTAEPQAMALHNSTGLFRILTVRGKNVTLGYRYETWVDYRSRPVLPRPDLRELAEKLNDQDEAMWSGDDTGDLTPRLTSAGETKLDPEHVVKIITAYLAEHGSR